MRPRGAPSSVDFTASVLTVKSGKVEVAAVTKTLLDRMVRDGRVAAADFVTLWVSPPIQQSVIYARHTMEPTLRAELVQLFVSLAQERPDIWKGIRIASTSGRWATCQPTTRCSTSSASSR